MFRHWISLISHPVTGSAETGAASYAGIIFSVILPYREGSVNFIAAGCQKEEEKRTETRKGSLIGGGAELTGSISSLRFTININLWEVAINMNSWKFFLKETEGKEKRKSLHNVLKKSQSWIFFDFHT